MKLAIITVGTADNYGGMFDIDVGDIVTVTESGEGEFRFSLYNLTTNEYVHWWNKGNKESIDWEYMDTPLLQLVCD